MATLVIRNADDSVHLRLKKVAAEHSRSMDEEARLILRRGLGVASLNTPQSFGQAMRAIFEPLGGAAFPEIPREPAREPPDFSGPEWDPPA